MGKAMVSGKSLSTPADRVLGVTHQQSGSQQGKGRLVMGEIQPGRMEIVSHSDRLFVFSMSGLKPAPEYACRQT
jgi:hypothetical protein